jgi:MraZ protein
VTKIVRSVGKSGGLWFLVGASLVMFYGEAAITIDDKGRLGVPASHRESLMAACGGRLVITYNPYEAECLWIFPQNEWERVRDQVMRLPSQKEAHRTLQRKIVGAASAVELDGNGRLLLPQAARTAAGLKKNAVLLGLGSKFELWSESAQKARLDQPIKESDVTAEMLNLQF